MRKKVMMLGEMAVGKTSIARRLALGRFEGDYKGTIGNDIFICKLAGLGPAKDQAMDLVIWDTDGGLGTATFKQDTAIKGSVGAIIVGDVMRPRTFQVMAEFARACDHYLPGRHVSFLLNKVDLLPEMTDYQLPSELTAFSHSIYMTSAKTGDNVTSAFSELANAIIRRGL